MKTHKQLKEEYKRMKFRIGVFQIRNMVNGKIFVGSGLNLNANWNSNRTQLRFGSHRNEGLQKEWKEFGEEHFVFEVLSEIEQKDGDTIDYGKEVKKLEEMFIEELQPFGVKGYNAPKPEK